MVQLEDDFIAAGAQIIWVLEDDRSFQSGTALSCRNFMDSLDSEVGLCVGDGQTEPVADAFDNSPFSENRGFDMIVRRSDMQVVYTTSHGTGSQNDNPTGQDVLDAVNAVIANQAP